MINFELLAQERGLPVWQFWAMFEIPQPVQLLNCTAVNLPCVRQSAPPICIAVPSWLLSLEGNCIIVKSMPLLARLFVQTYASHLHNPDDLKKIGFSRHSFMNRDKTKSVFCQTFLMHVTATYISFALGGAHNSRLQIKINL